jgi:hypothetical protein
LLSFFVAQYVAHAAGGYKPSRRCQRPLATTSHLAGFEVTTYGRFWVTPEEVKSPLDLYQAGFSK